MSENVLRMPGRMARPVLVSDVDAPMGPTPERVRQAQARQQSVISTSNNADEDDISTWKIAPALDDLLRRGTIEQEEYQAAMKFLRHYYLGIYVGPRTSSFRERVNGAAPVDRDTRRVHYAREVEKAILAVDPMFHRALAWMISSLGEGWPLRVLGEHYAPNLGAQTQSARGGQALATACAMLCRHYGMQHRLNIEKRLSELAQFLLDNR